MGPISLLSASALLLATLMSCATDDPGTQPQESKVYSISGRVVYGDTIPFVGLSVASGARVVLTDSSGRYEFDSLLPGTYIVKPESTEFDFEPVSRTVTIGSASVETQDFSAVTGAPTLEMILVPPGSFIMGKTTVKGEPSQASARPAHNVTLTRSFYMARYELTQKQYSQLMGPYPEVHTRGKNHPATNLTVVLLAEFCNKLSLAEGYQPACTIIGPEVRIDVTKSGYRFPTEAEWEYVCRAGTTTDTYYGDHRNEPKSVKDSIRAILGWYLRSSPAGPDGIPIMHEVGLIKPSPWGFYDIYGNAEELMADSFYEPYDSTNAVDPYVHLSNSTVVVRGGSVSHFGPSAAYDRYELSILLNAHPATIRPVRTKL